MLAHNTMITFTADLSLQYNRTYKVQDKKNCIFNITLHSDISYAFKNIS